MPWCEGCARFLNPNTLRPDGSCPSCDRKVAEPADASPHEPDANTSSGSSTSPENQVVAELGLDHLPASETDVPKAPWHFKLLVVLTVIYMTWRFVEMAGFLG